jgi:heat shock protein HslJ
MWIRKHPQKALPIILLLVFLVGCRSVEAGLAGTSWELVSVNGKDLIVGTVITLNFADEYLGGEMGCNGYGGSPDSGKYRVTTDGTFSLILPIAVTVQSCSEPEGIMEQETAYIEALKNVAHFQIKYERLDLKNEIGEKILIFTRK